MRLLLDTCVWGGATAELRQLGHDVLWCGEFPTDPGDAEILAMSVREERVLITLDKDFGGLVFLHGAKHHGIIRLVEIPSRLQAQAIEAVLREHHRALVLGAIATLKDGRLRLRTPLQLLRGKGKR